MAKERGGIEPDDDIDDEQDEDEDDESEEDDDEVASDGAYFVMACEGITPATSVTRVSVWKGGPWMTGRPIKQAVPNPFVFQTDAMYPGALKPMYQGPVLLMRDDLIEALTAAGVDNLQLFPALIRDDKTKQEHTNYKAVNIIGVVSAADMGKSKRMDPSDTTERIAVRFDTLVLDESKPQGTLLFRLAEAVNAIVVHRSVRERVESIRGMTFYPSGQWSG